MNSKKQYANLMAEINQEMKCEKILKKSEYAKQKMMAMPTRTVRIDSRTLILSRNINLTDEQIVANYIANHSKEHSKQIGCKVGRKRK